MLRRRERPSSSSVVREASFVSRCRIGCGMFARYTSRFRDLQSKAGTPLADFVNSLLANHGPLPFGLGDCFDNQSGEISSKC
jgi:hypothetical protein